MTIATQSESRRKPAGDQLVHPPPLTAETQAKLAELRQRVEQLQPPKALLEWLDDACLYRYLRARQGHVDKALAMLQNSVKWRQEFGVARLPTDHFSDVAVIGSVGCNYVHGKDLYGRPVVYMKPRYNMKPAPTQLQQVRHLVYTLERAILEMDEGVEKYVFIIDFNGYSMRTAPSFSTQRECATIFQDQYPERLGLAVMVDAPFLFHQSFKMLKPFLDAVTVKKVVFVSGEEKKAFFEAHFDLRELEVEYGGQDDHAYDPQRYFATHPRILGCSPLPAATAT
eukprot:EG_transcript_14693